MVRVNSWYSLLPFLAETLEGAETAAACAGSNTASEHMPVAPCASRALASPNGPEPSPSGDLQQATRRHPAEQKQPSACIMNR